jgi:hypothetical protein
MVRLLRHRQTKGPGSARPHLHRRATPRLHLKFRFLPVQFALFRLEFSPTVSQHESLAYDECHETTSDTAHSPSVWTPKTGRCGAGIGDSWKCAAAQRRSGRNTLDWPAHVFVGTDCSRRVVRPSRCHPRVLDCQGSRHRREGGATSVTQSWVADCNRDVTPTGASRKCVTSRTRG